MQEMGPIMEVCLAGGLIRNKDAQTALFPLLQTDHLAHYVILRYASRAETCAQRHKKAIKCLVIQWTIDLIETRLLEIIG